MSHTIGPWRVDHCNPSPTTGEWMIAGGKPGYLAEVRDCGSGDVRANARLISAAPELLDALQSIVDAYQRHFDVMPVAWQTYDTIARAAIAKATGETA